MILIRLRPDVLLQVEPAMEGYLLARLGAVPVSRWPRKIAQVRQVLDSS